MVKNFGAAILLGLASCGVFATHQSLKLSLFGDREKPIPVRGVPERANWARIFFTGHGWTEIWPVVGSAIVKVDGQMIEIALQDESPFHVWSISKFRGEDFLGVGWTESPNDGILASFTVEWNGNAPGIRCTEVFPEGNVVSGTSIAHLHSAFPSTIVLFDQRSHTLFYWSYLHGNPREVLKPLEYPGLNEMEYFFLLSGESDSNSSKGALSIHFQQEVTSGLGPPDSTSPYGIAMDIAGDGIIEDVEFTNCGRNQ